ncbi:hypothetical protein KUM42_17325 [Modestobacter sp. L9-4]|uniref:hypothetical protein n=1 Tax=Modestobacter sp. L9-4 TaxID=2851567 RepID=UPI001C74D350|nr:hypothetical protein [Modestobacter sp. L9-4]QXG75548.1 hypothetical protein KUM42_17325 [Modestobacter sp. L9-4]
MLELGRRGSHGTPQGTFPVLADGVAVAVLRASNWREQATADVGGRSWVFGRAGSRDVTARWAADPDGTARMRAHRPSSWRNDWTLDLEGVAVQMANASSWKGTNRYTLDGRQVAESGTVSFWSTDRTLQADPVLTLDAQVFLLWFERVLSRRRSAAAA